MYQQQSFQQGQFAPYQQQPVVSQYRGLQKQYQPTGYVQSFYNPSQSQSNQFSQPQMSNSINSQSYHTAQYRGNQPGHDQYLRADSQQPTNQGFGMNQAQGSGMNQAQGSQFGQAGFNSSFQNSYAQQNQQSYQSPQSFHTANYRGNQQGHDQYLRADSQQPTNQVFGMNQAQGSQIGQAGFNSSLQNSYAQQNQQSYQSPQSFHTANYRGNQPGHDQSLRSDSFGPSQSGAFGMNRSF